ncbi:hypothetical protein BJF83_20250 [Nocardiopsis sp. CNR-923]|uniref:hypothetical protein n=1 Tax=Nocardiopsis sp. CNR-923 TaxID=1904965 RepID=UPI0009656909|nr:hypothetical protein [Nocardiopsis sp. CNR-923]OLT26838.1 hypothetical protein BJF83_20250 [Nocardiopsis sp. CNR-923]
MGSVTGAEPGIGLYSISVRGLEVPDLLGWARAEGVAFVHLRGGTRGYALTERDAATLKHWRAVTEQTVPITGVTADTDLAELLDTDATVRDRARRSLGRMAWAAASLGAGWVRLLARTPLDPAMVQRAGAVPVMAVPLLVELHHPAWLTPAPATALGRLLDQSPHLRVLADTAQLAAMLTTVGPHTVAGLDRVIAATNVLHLSDQGHGLRHPGHAQIATAIARRLDDDHEIEVAVEWTGPDRSPATALDRYRAATAWWRGLREQHRRSHV